GLGELRNEWVAYNTSKNTFVVTTLVVPSVKARLKASLQVQFSLFQGVVTDDMNDHSKRPDSNDKIGRDAPILYRIFPACPVFFCNGCFKRILPDVCNHNPTRRIAQNTG